MTFRGRDVSSGWAGGPEAAICSVGGRRAKGLGVLGITVAFPRVKCDDGRTSGELSLVGSADIAKLFTTVLSDSELRRERPDKRSLSSTCLSYHFDF